MASSINPIGYIEEAVIDNHLQVAGERGLTVEEWADQVAPESEHLAEALRERAAAQRAAAGVDADSTPKGRRTSAPDTTTKEG